MTPGDAHRLVAGEAAVAWMQAIENRYRADFTVSEVTRALRALSSAYVERRGALERGAALDSAGKRAAFALVFGPLHFLIVRAIVRELDAARDMPRLLVDLGCGTGVGGAAWALEAASPPRLLGFDRHPWAVAEAAWTWRTLGLGGRAIAGDATRARWDSRAPAVLAAYVVNELDAPSRAALLERLLAVSTAGGRVLIVEPIARALAPWWPDWASAFTAVGGRSHEWTLAPDLPERLALFSKGAGLNHRQVKARSLYLGPRPAQGPRARP